MSIDIITLWHERARPKPTHRDLQVQLGCHFEEIAEMLEELIGADDYSEVLLTKLSVHMHKMAGTLKAGTATVNIRDRKQFLDALADQIVTVTGVGHCARMNVTEATRRVNESNWSKFGKDGHPIRDMHGKISKGPDYAPPNLEGLY